MSDQNSKNQSSEEVDLGQLFRFIGKAFDRLFKFLASLLKSIFLLLIGIILFIKRNIIILVLACVVGFIYGFIKEKYSKTVYSSYAVIKQNYDTGESLSILLDYYNDLINDSDTLTLSQSLSIQPKEASYLVSFDMESVLNKNSKLKVFDNFKKEIDSTIAKDIDFEEFLENSYDYQYEFQRLTIKTTEKTLLKRVIPNIIKNIEEIDYFKSLQKRDVRELDNREQIIMESLKESDSLQKIYQKVLEKQQLSDGQTTVLINNAEENNQTKEFQLFENDIELRRELVEIRREREDIEHILEIISSQQDQGIVDNTVEVFKKKISKRIFYSLFLGGLVFLILVGIKFLNFLKEYED